MANRVGAAVATASLIVGVTTAAQERGAADAAMMDERFPRNAK